MGSQHYWPKKASKEDRGRGTEWACQAALRLSSSATLALTAPPQRSRTPPWSVDPAPTQAQPSHGAHPELGKQTRPLPQARPLPSRALPRSL